jgi:hypothetical protein
MKMDRDDLIASVSRLEAVGDRFEKIADKVEAHESRISSLEQSRRSVGKAVASIVAPLIVGLLLAFLVSKGVKP